MKHMLSMKHNFLAGRSPEFHGRPSRVEPFRGWFLENPAAGRREGQKLLPLAGDSFTLPVVKVLFVPDCS